MNWTDEKIALIRRMGKMQFLIKDVATALQVDLMEFQSEMDNPESEAYQAFHSERILAELEIKERNHVLAEGGSPAAIKEFLDQVQNYKASE